MNVPLLIDALVRQMTVLIAQLATSGGIRAPLAHIANQVFVDLAHELQRESDKLHEGLDPIAAEGGGVGGVRFARDQAELRAALRSVLDDIAAGR